MSNLKPQLIVTGSHKKKSSFASGIGYFLVLVIVFVLGVYVGMRIDSTDFEQDHIGQVSKDTTSSVEKVEERTQNEVARVETESASENDVMVTMPETQFQTSANIDQVTAADSKNSVSEGEINSEDEISMITSKNESRAGARDGLNPIKTDIDNQLEPDDDAYRLQVAAFGNMDDASEFVDALKLKGYEAYIVTTSNSRGEVWNFIKIGNVKTAKEAWNLSKIYQSNEGGEVFVESLNKGRVYNESLEEEPSDVINTQE
jgi:cell division septation protein DedD